MARQVDRAELESLLQRDEDELYVLLTQSNPEFADTFFSADEARERGRLTFQQLSGPVHRRVCTEWRYCERRGSPELADTVTLAAAVSDVIATVVGGLPVGTIAAILVKKGVDRFCACLAGEAAEPAPT
jgi:hypothetical protein